MFEKLKAWWARRKRRKELLAIVQAIDAYIEQHWIEQPKEFFEERAWKLANGARLVHERYIRGDVIVLCHHHKELACWVDQRHAYKGLMGRNDFQFDSSLTLDMVKGFLKEDDASSI